MNDKIKTIRELCTCGLHGLGIEVEDTPEMRKRIENCHAYELAGPPETRADWFRKHGLQESAS